MAPFDHIGVNVEGDVICEEDKRKKQGKGDSGQGSEWENAGNKQPLFYLHDKVLFPEERASSTTESLILGNNINYMQM